MTQRWEVRRKHPNPGEGAVDLDLGDCVVFGCVESAKDFAGKNG